MKIQTVRRISQIFFFLLFIWFCLISSVGADWYQLRGWPVNWILQLDPLVAVGTVLTTRVLYTGLLWALATIVLTILVGRFFCGWLCPFGTIHQFVGWLGRVNKHRQEKIERNRYRPAQKIKYLILLFMLGCALTGVVFSSEGLIAASLQTGLLDPIPLVHRSVNIALLPILDSVPQRISASTRYYEGAWLVGAIFVAAVLLNLYIPRFYCRFVCPLGALFGVTGRFSLWRIGKIKSACPDCGACEKNCDGACSPSSKIHWHECVMCMNCIRSCPHGDLIHYRSRRSAAGELTAPDLSRRQCIAWLASGIAAVPLLRLSGALASNYHPELIRPPGALSEGGFLDRCIKCDQCMRVCPTNVLQPAGLRYGLEALWTPLLNNRIGTSGCQYNCIACGNICPTGAIRPITLDEKHGKGQFSDRGPIRLGTAFVDHGRCLPWTMDKPCIVCQENCPVSPKAIFTREYFNTVREGTLKVKYADQNTIVVDGVALEPGRYGTGDYHLRIDNPDLRPRRQAHHRRRLIKDNTSTSILISSEDSLDPPPPEGTTIEVQIRLLRPYVEPERCIGCGVCEHECPVSGKRAIRVTAENESRNKKHSLLLKQ